MYWNIFLYVCALTSTTVLTSLIQSTICWTISSVVNTSYGYSSGSDWRSRELFMSTSIGKSSSPLDSLPESTFSNVSSSDSMVADITQLAHNKLYSVDFGQKLRNNQHTQKTTKKSNKKKSLTMPLWNGHKHTRSICFWCPFTQFTWSYNEFYYRLLPLYFHDKCCLVQHNDNWAKRKTKNRKKISPAAPRTAKVAIAPTDKITWTRSTHKYKS